MVSVDDWSETPDDNDTVDGISIAENLTTTGNVNNAMRAIMAGVASFKAAYDTLAASISSYMPKSGGTFSGTQPKYISEGAFIHNADSGNSSGRMTFLPDGSADPSGSNGDLVFFYQ